MAQDHLRQASKDVELPDSSAGMDDVADVVESADDPATGAGNQPDVGGKNKGRGVDEVRGELLRKLERAEESTNERLARIERMLSGRAEIPSAQGQDAVTIENATVAQLEALRPQIPAEKREAFEQLVRQRREDERVDARFQANWKKHETENIKKNAVQTAYERFPELHDNSSRLYKMTNKVLDEYGDTVVKSNPRAVLDAANEAAARLGIVASRTGALGRTPSSSAPSGATGPVPGGSGGTTLSDERARSIAKRLSNALPSGKKFSAEQLKRIKEQHAEYNKHRNLLIK